jgi:hypothetical protein
VEEGSGFVIEKPISWEARDEDRVVASFIDKSP